MTIVLISREDDLGTRLINLVNGIFFARRHNLKYKINWEINYNKCKVELKDLIINIQYSNLNNKKLLKNNNYLVYKYIEQKYFDDEKFNLEKLNGKNILYLGHFNYIKKNNFANIFSKFKLNNYINQIVNIFKIFELENIIGVHVRKDDLINNKNMNLTKKCNNRLINCDKYFNYLDKNKIKVIFLCTDDENIYNKFSKKYKVIRYYHDSLSRTPNIELQDAFIDMILLSKCKEIISGKSNFSLCASCIGNKKLIILIK